VKLHTDKKKNNKTPKQPPHYNRKKNQKPATKPSQPQTCHATTGYVNSPNLTVTDSYGN